MTRSRAPPPSDAYCKTSAMTRRRWSSMFSLTLTGNKMLRQDKVMCSSSDKTSRQALYVAVTLLLLLILVMVVVNVSGSVRNPYSLGLVEKAELNVDQPPGSIFVSIASYRDHECPETINSLFSKARDPSRIYVGLCVQNGKADPSCPGELCDKCVGANIRVFKMPYEKARGPAYARYHCAKLYKGEDYFMQIDSHMQFIQNWDDLIINELHKCTPLLRPGAHAAVLTHYPPADMTDEFAHAP